MSINFLIVMVLATVKIIALNVVLQIISRLQLSN